MNEWQIFRFALPLLLLGIAFAVGSIPRLLGHRPRRRASTRRNGDSASPREMLLRLDARQVA
jgi:hypothetical protein